jgi:O-antigen ligase
LLGAIISWYAARRLEWAALGLFLLVPLGRLTWLNDTGTLDVTKFLVAALALAWFARCLLTRDRNLVAVWTESPISVLLLLFLLANFVSLLNVWDLRRSLLSLLRLSALLVMYTLMVAMVRSKRDVKIAISFLLLTGLAVCLLGVWESTTHQYLWHLLGQDRSLPPGLANSSGLGTAAAPFALRIITVFIDYNFMGGYMAVLFGIVGGCAMATRRWYLRLALAGLALLILYNLVETGSRGGMIGLSVAALALLVMSRLRIRWFLLATVLVIAIVIFPVADQLVPQFRGGISLEDLKQDQRWGYWQMALRMMQDHPIIGVGTDNFFSLYSWYRTSPALMSPYYCHNIYLQMWAEAGILGLLSILSLVTAVMLTYIRALREATDEVWRSLVVGLLAAFLGYAVFSASCNTLHDQPFWMLMALSVIVLRATRQRPAGIQDASIKSPSSPDSGAA